MVLRFSKNTYFELKHYQHRLFYKKGYTKQKTPKLLSEF